MNSSDEDTFLYFAYGSNLSAARIHINNPSAEFYSTAKLENHRLVFTRRKYLPISKLWKGGTASIMESPCSVVWGVVWTMNKKDIPNLDRQERNYKIIYVNVETPQGEVLNCRTYQMMGLVVELPTSPQYLEVIMTGAASSGLPDYYQKFLSEVEHNGYSGALQLGEEFEQEQKLVQINNDADLHTKLRSGERVTSSSTMMNSSEDTFLYFAFGSNLSAARIHINNPSAEFYSTAKLEEYRLVFACQENGPVDVRWNGGVASILQSPKNTVWGVVWKINKKDMQNLDKQEGGYTAIHIEVDSPKGEVLHCRTYQMIDPIIELPPSPQYLEVIMTGAASSGLPDYYQKSLSEVEHNGYSGPLQVMSQLGEKFTKEQKLVQKR